MTKNRSGSGGSERVRQPGASNIGDVRARLALRLVRLGRLAEAAPHIKALAEQPGVDGKVWERLARVLPEMDDPDFEAAALTARLERCPAEATTRERLLRVLGRLERNAEMIPHLRVLAEADPDQPARWSRLAAAAAAGDDLDSQIIALERQLELAGDDRTLRKHLVRALQQAGREAETLPHLKAIAESHSGAGKWGQVVRAAAAAGDIEQEIEAMSRRVELSSGDGPARTRLIRLLIEHGRHAEAAVHLGALVDADPSDQRSWNLLGRALAAAGDVDGEIAVLSRRLELGHEDASVRSRLVRLLSQAGRLGEAVPHLWVLAEAAPGDARTWNLLTRAVAGDVEGEIAVLGRRVELGQGPPATRTRLVRLLMENDRKPDAIPHLWALAEASPEDLATWTRLSRVLADVGDLEGEVVALQRMLELSSSRDAA